jgi:Phage integrase, N-terminal SAM-like domain
MTFKEYLIQKGLSKSTADTYQKQLYYFVNWCQDQNIEPETATYNEVLGFIQELQKRQNIQATVSTYVNSLKHYFSWVMDRGFREHNPVHHIKIRGIKRKHLYHIIPMRELGQLYEKYPVMQKNKDMENQNWYRQSILTSNRNKVMLGLLIWQGITAKNNHPRPENKRRKNTHTFGKAQQRKGIKIRIDADTGTNGIHQADKATVTATKNNTHRLVIYQQNKWCITTEQHNIDDEKNRAAKSPNQESETNPGKCNNPLAQRP